MRPCFAFTAKTASKPAVLAINDEIGFWGMQAKEFRQQLDAVDGDLLVEINSPGGDVFAGLAMYNMLRSAAEAGRQITTKVTGIAASIASVIALAGDKRLMPKNTMAMLHGASTGVWGTADELREQADVVDKINANMQQLYAARMGVDADVAASFVAKDNWFTADECLENGFATDLIDEVSLTAKFDMEHSELPDNIKAMFKAQDEQSEPEPEPEPEPTQAEVTALAEPEAQKIAAMAEGLGLGAHATFFALSCDSVATATARMEVAREITALCDVTGMKAEAKALIRAGTTLADARTALMAKLAAEDTHIESAPRNTEVTASGDKSKPTGVNTGSIWASHNAQLKGR